MQDPREQAPVRPVQPREGEVSRDPLRRQKDGPKDPVHRTENRQVNRRGFMGMLTALTATLAAAAVPAVGVLGEDRPPAGAGEGPAGGAQDGPAPVGEEPVVAVARLDEIPVGGAVNFAYPDAHQPAILVRLETGELRAYNNRCTHLECPVYWAAQEGWLRCPCHEGIFDAQNGKPLWGPPQRQLTGIRLRVVDGVVYAVGRYQA